MATNPGPRLLHIPANEGLSLRFTHVRKRKSRQLGLLYFLNIVNEIQFTYTVKTSFLGVQSYEFWQIQSYDYHYN